MPMAFTGSGTINLGSSNIVVSYQLDGYVTLNGTLELSGGASPQWVTNKVHISQCPIGGVL